MILYNMCYRGPYEYDKTVLNVLQFHNEVMDALDSLHSMQEGSMQDALTKMGTISSELHNLLQDIYTLREQRKEV